MCSLSFLSLQIAGSNSIHHCSPKNSTGQRFACLGSGVFSFLRVVSPMAGDKREGLTINLALSNGTTTWREGSSKSTVDLIFTS